MDHKEIWQEAYDKGREELGMSESAAEKYAQEAVIDRLSEAYDRAKDIRKYGRLA